MKKYDTYKDSGVKWIREVPEHWEITPLKFCFNVLSGATPKSTELSYWEDGNINWITPADFKTEDRFISDGAKKITKEGFMSCSTTLIPSGSIIFSKRAPIGSVVINRNEVCTNQGCLSCIPKDDISSLFFYYIMSVSQKYFDMLGTGTTFNEISANVFKNVHLPVPPLSEQQSIAFYLDVKTEKIDKMIAKAEKKIEYLDELKQSLITRAVIRGLNPNAPLKDSGMKWIGEIPEHWKIMPFKYYGKLCKGLTFSKADLTATGVPVISYGQIHSKENKSVRFFEEGIRFIPRELAKNGDSALVKQGDFIFADTSEDLEGCGNCVYNDTTNPIYAGYHTIIYKTRERDCKYLAYLFRSNVWRSQIRCRVSGIKVYSITQGIMSQVNILLPPMSEQKEISTYLDTKCSKIDHIIATQKKKIAYLQELKQSLITNVVTGKIKVS